ncbi:putative ribonuclease H-like domain-containing protein [Tanacetum coccineum]
MNPLLGRIAGKQKNDRVQAMWGLGYCINNACEHPSETIVFHNEDGNPARANIKQALGYRKDGDGDGNSQPHKGVKASANSDVKYSFTSAQDGEPLQDDVRLCLGNDLKKAQDHSQRHVAHDWEQAYLAVIQDFNGGPDAFWSLSYLNENQYYLKSQQTTLQFHLVNIVPSGGLACLIAKATTDESNKWHMRLGHVNFKNLNKLVKGNLVRGLPSKIFQNDHTCVAFQKEESNTRPLSENQANQNAGQQEANQNAGQQEANQHAGVEETIDAGDSEKEDESAQDCFLLQKQKRTNHKRTSHPLFYLLFPAQHGPKRFQKHLKMKAGWNAMQEELKPLVKDEEANDVDVHLYRSMIGSLMYLTASRPDIMFAVCACSRFQVTPKSSHLSAVKRIFSDYAGANLDRKSITGEAEYVAAASCCGQVFNPVYHSKTKHIAIRHHFIRDAYEKKLIQVLKIHTDDNVADLLTKAFDVSRNMVSIGDAFPEFWTSAKPKTINNVRHITAKVAGMSVSISEASIRSDLRFDDADGIDTLPNQAIFNAIQQMGSKSTSWDQIPTNIATVVICLTSNQKYNFSKLIFDGKQLVDVSLPLDHFPVNTLTSKVFSFMVKKGKHFSGKVTPLFATMLVQPTQDEGASSERPSEAQPTPSPAPTSKVPYEPHTDSSPAQTSEVPIEYQPNPSPRPSPTPTILASIPKTSGENLGGHSSSNKSLSGNEGDMTIQGVYDLCLSLCKQVSDQAKEIKDLKAQITKLKKQAKPVIKHHKAYLKSVSLKQRFPRKSFSKKHRVHKESVSKQGRKVAKGEPSVQRDPLFDGMTEDTVNHMETENAQDEGRTREIVNEDKEIDEVRLSTEDEVSTLKDGVSTDFEKVSTDRPIVSTDGSKVSTDRQVEGVEEQVKGTNELKEGTNELKEGTDELKEGTEENNESTEEQREGTEEKVESTDGQIKGTEDQTEEEIATQATQTSTQTPTSMIFGDDETIATLLLNMSQAKAASKEKEKGVELKDVEETDRPRPTSTRSLLTLKPLPKIDPKDKGKKKIEEEDESESESDGIPQAEKKFKQLESDEELARKVQEEWEAEEERNRIAEENAANEELIKDFDDIKARIEADRLLAEKLQEQEREQFTIEERAKFLHDTIAAQRKFLAQQRSEAIRNKPPTKNQLRNQMMTYLKHEEVQALYEKIKRSDEDFISIGSAEDERLIKRMNERGVDLSKSEVIKEESKEEVKEEDKDEESTRKRKLGTRKKMKSRKRRYIQNTSEDDSDKENDELRLYLTIVPDEEKEVDYEILDRKYPIKEWKTECLGARPQTDQAEHLEEINLNVVIRSNGQKRYFHTLMTVLSIFDREDLNVVYQLVMEKYQDEMNEGFNRVLWGDLMVLFNPDDKDEFWSSRLD